MTNPAGVQLRKERERLGGPGISEFTQSPELSALDWRVQPGLLFKWENGNRNTDLIHLRAVWHGGWYARRQWGHFYVYRRPSTLSSLSVSCSKVSPRLFFLCLDQRLLFISAAPTTGFLELPSIFLTG